MTKQDKLSESSWISLFKDPHHKSTGTRYDYVPSRFRLSVVYQFGSGSSVVDPHHFDEDLDPGSGSCVSL